VAGCVGYRGYFDEAQARAAATELEAQGYEANVYPVPAYSTLGWLNWAGGDPLLNTFIHYPEGELARLLFHELAHQVLYVKDDTTFNESFATAVERLGIARWLATQAPESARREYADLEARRAQFRALTRSTRSLLQQIYDAPSALLTASERTSRKQEVLREFRARYEGLRATWGDPARFRNYDRWVAGANNATFGAQAAYDELVPGFEALFVREGRDFARFYDAARKLADLPRAQRHQRLKDGL
jgi:predicted aminopeptidase